METKKDIEFLGLREIKGQKVAEFKYLDTFGFYIYAKAKLSGKYKMSPGKFWDRQNTKHEVTFNDVPDANTALHKAYQLTASKLKEANAQEQGQLKLI